WIDGQSVRLEPRWAKGQGSEIRKNVIDAVATAPDVILCTGSAGLVPLLQATRTVPIVFVNVADPVGSGLVKTMAHPGGNATGFIQFEYTLSSKWPELLKQIAPNVTRVAVLRDANIPGGIGQFAVIQAAASSLGLEVSAINEANEHSIERDVTEF